MPQGNRLVLPDESTIKRNPSFCNCHAKNTARQFKISAMLIPLITVVVVKVLNGRLLHKRFFGLVDRAILCGHEVVVSLVCGPIVDAASFAVGVVVTELPCFIVGPGKQDQFQRRHQKCKNKTLYCYSAFQNSRLQISSNIT